LNTRLAQGVGGAAFSSMNPAVVTGASVAIPAMLKYIADYLAVVDSGIGAYDDPLTVGVNFTRALYGDGEPWRDMRDDEGRLRLDENELEPALQQAITASWADARPGDPPPLTARGLELFKQQFMQLYGWQVDGVDYETPVDFLPEFADGVVQLIDE